MPKIIEPVEQTTDGFLEYVRQRRSHKEDAKSASAELGGLASAYVERTGDNKTGLSMAVRFMELPREKAADALRTLDAYLPHIRARIAEQAEMPLEPTATAAPPEPAPVADIAKARAKRTKQELDEYNASA